MVEERWKLIRRSPSPVLPTEELFDLESDPCEGTDLLLTSPNEEARAAGYPYVGGAPTPLVKPPDTHFVSMIEGRRLPPGPRVLLPYES